MKRYTLMAAIVVLLGLTSCAGPDVEAAIASCREAVVQLERDAGGDVDLEYINAATEACRDDYDEDPEGFLELWGD